MANLNFFFGNRSAAAPAVVGKLWVKHASTWKEPKLQVKHSGTWKEPTKAFVKTGGVWKQVYTAPMVIADPTLVLDLDFTAGTLDSKVTFTRSTTATRVNSSGVIASAAIDAPRFDHNPVTLAARGLLLEEQRTNVLLYSQDFSNGAWLTYLTGAKVGAGGTAPDGGSAYEIAFGASADGQVYQAYSFPGATYTFSCYVRAKTGSTTIRLQLYDSAVATIATATVTDAAWTRVTVSATGGGGGGSLAIMNNVSGTATNVYVWGAQLEVGAFVSSYIPTTSAAVTRAADVAVMAGTNFSSWWNAAAGTFVAAFDGPATGTRPIIAADDNTANEVFMLYGSGTDPKAIVTDGGATQADLDAGTLVANTAAKLGLSFAANDFAACLNGGTVAVDTGGTLPTVTQARLGSGPAGNYLAGHLASLKFYNVAKTDAELQAATT